MRVAVLGTGGVGGILGVKWAQAGHQVMFGSRSPDAAKLADLLAKAGDGAQVARLPEAAHSADVVVLAVPWPAALETLTLIGGCPSKILIDCTNPLKSDLSGLSTEGVSAGEQIAQWAPQARVVKAFNTASTKVMNNPGFAAGPATMFFCGDDAEAKSVVASLIRDVGFDPVDAGPLQHARHLESLAMLYIHLAVRGGWGSNCAFQMVKR
jgi:NADPH-dependent F420 reductase